MKHFKLLTSIIFFVILSSCATTNSIENEQSFLGFWNSHDMEYVAEDIVKDIVESHAYQSCYKYFGRKPVLCAGIFENLSGELFDTKTLTAKFNQEFKIQKLEYEVIDTSDILTVRQNAESAGCDLFIAGSVKTVVDKTPGKMQRQFVVTANLYDLSTDKKIWTGQHNSVVKAIRKFVK